MTRIDIACYERGCACHDDRVDGETVEVVQRREWVGLTDEEREQFRQWAHPDIIEAIELKLQERNT